MSFFECFFSLYKKNGYWQFRLLYSANNIKNMVIIDCIKNYDRKIQTLASGDEPRHL